MRESFSVRFLYGTALGRMLLKPLVQPWVSRLAGRFLSCAASKGLVAYYIKKHGISLEGIEIPEGGFSSFNEFFTRKRKEEPKRPEKDCLISPCDGFLTVTGIGEGTVFPVKQSRFSLKDLLAVSALAEKFSGGTALIFRLTPANYHRYCYGMDADVVARHKIAGKFHCVRPIALRTTPVFVQNSREYTVMKTDRFGTAVQMEVGALLVGKIRNHEDQRHVFAGQEKGWFEFGGSTIILLIQKDRFTFEKALYERCNEAREIPVCMGEIIGKA